MNKILNTKKARRISFILLSVSIVVLMLYIYRYNVVFVDSDASSGLLFAKEIKNSGQILPTTWHYSTTIFLLDYPLVYSLMFCLSSSWIIVRTTGTFIIIVLYLISAYYFFRKIKIKNIYLSLLILLMPFSIVYFGMYLVMPYYVFVSIKIFLSIAVIIDIFETNSKKKKNILMLIILLLSFAQGLDGFRNIILFIVPMSLTLAVLIAIEKSGKLKIRINIRESILIIFLVLFSCLIGYLINSLVLVKYLGIESVSEVTYGELTAEIIVQEIKSWLDVFGYSTGKVFSLATVHNLLCFATIGLSIIAIISNIKNIYDLNYSGLILTFYYIFAVLILIYFGVFVDMNKIGLFDLARYNVSIAILAIPIILWWLENSSLNNYGKYIYIIFVVLLFVSGIDNYVSCKDNNQEVLKKINSGRVNNDTVELNDIVYMLKESGYKNGYSYFWCGNVITELSNGEIEMWVLAPGGSQTKILDDLNIRYKWLQPKRHDTSMPKEKTFIIFNKEERDYSCITERLKWDNVFYDSENYTVYAYDTNEGLVEDFYN